MGEGGLRRALFWRGFWVPILVPSLGSKMGAKFINFWVQLQTFFGGLLELLGCLLGAFLGLLRLSWEASRVKKCRQSHAKTGFVNAVFWFFEAPNGPLGLILVPFGWIWSQTWVPNGLKSLVKSDQQVGSLFDQKKDHFWVPKRVPESC